MDQLEAADNVQHKIAPGKLGNFRFRFVLQTYGSRGHWICFHSSTKSAGLLQSFYQPSNLRVVTETIVSRMDSDCTDFGQVFHLGLLEKKQVVLEEMEVFKGH